MTVQTTVVMSFLIAAIATPVLARYARAHGLLDHPSVRSSHTTPTPRIGGSAVVLGVLIAVSVTGKVGDPRIGIIVSVACLLALIGLIDDLRGVAPLVKYAAQLAAAVAVTVALQPRMSVVLPWVEFQLDGLAAAVLTALWLTIITNAFNFMDGIDGLSAGVALVVAVAGTAFVSSASGVTLLALAGAAMGFALWNAHPSSIFLGDVGSQFIGFLLGALLLLNSGTLGVPVVPVLILFGPYLLDTGYTLARRAAAGQNLLHAHREHLYQRLVAIGYTHRAVANWYILMSAACALAAMVYQFSGASASWGVLASLAVVAGAAPLAVAAAERRPRH